MSQGLQSSLSVCSTLNHSAGKHGGGAVLAANAGARMVQILKLPVDRLRRDGDTQHRQQIDDSVERQYASLMAEGVQFPPIRVWHDGSDYWLSDGFQRLAAAEIAGIAQIDAEVREGTLADAQWDSYSANSVHGVRRTSAETEGVIRLALQHPNSRSLSNVQLAKHLGVGEATVRRWRRRLSSSRDDDSVRIVTRNRTTYPLDTQPISAHNCGRRLKARRELRSDLAAMKDSASPDARRILAIIGNWALGPAKAGECLDAIERAIKEWLRVGSCDRSEPLSN